MTIDPYKTLGVDRNATLDEIKKAYRAQAKRSHPDAGGNSEKFGEVNRSFLVLSDPARRACFDETGDLDEGPSQEDEPLALVLQTIDRMLKEIEDPWTRDFVGMARDILRERGTNISQALVTTAKEIKKTHRMLGRFKVKDGTNQLDDFLRKRLGVLNQATEKVRHDQAVNDAALLILANYEFAAEPPPPPVGFTNPVNFSGGSGFMRMG